MIATHMHRFIKFTPWQLHSVARNVFAGRIPSIRAGALVHDALGQPPFVIAISDGMYTAADQCVYLWESSMRLFTDAQADLQRGHSTEDVISKLRETIMVRGLEQRVERTVGQLRHLLRGEHHTSLLRVSLEDIELPIAGVPKGDLRHRPTRQYVWEQFVIAHELAHIILSHLGSTGSPTATRYAQDAIHDYRILPTWDMLTNDNQRAEAEADLFGLFELSYATSWEMSRRAGVRAGWRDRSQLALLVQHLDGVAIATLVFYLVSALGVPAPHTSTHPHPDHRLALITEAALTRMKAIISTTSEPDEGHHNLPGFYERALFLTEDSTRIPRHR
jgi:hypothetical protein